MRGSSLMVVALAALAPGAHGGLPQTASGCPGEMPHTENERIAEFRRIYGTWPPKITLPGRDPMRETAEWSAYHRKKEAGLMELTDHQERWEFWLEQAQIRLLTNFTETGWAKGHMPEEVHRQALEHFRSELPTLREKPNRSVPLYTTGNQAMVGLPGAIRSAITEATRAKVAEWVGMDPDMLEPTSTFGIRNYWKGSTLKTHVDRVETHILSAVYCVDAKYSDGAEKWLMETDPDLTGKHVSVDVMPGELFYYESAKLVHGRPSTLQGDYSAHVFIHFRPRGWSFTNVDRVYGVPPGFQEAALHDRQDL